MPSRVFYRSSTDGWRIGTADVAHTNKVTVTDAVMPLQETCRMADIYAPPDDANALLDMGAHPETFIRSPDAAIMEPCPLIALPPIVELMRIRSQAATPTLSIGDNVDVLIHHRNDKTVVGHAPPTHTTAVQQMSAKVVAALHASLQSQVVVASGHAPSGFSAVLTAAICAKTKAPASLASRLDAAHVVLSAFATTVFDRKGQHVVRDVSIDFERDDSGYVSRPSSAKVSLHLLNLHHFGLPGGCDDNFRIFAMLIYAFNHEEKERIHLNRKQTDFQTQRVVKDLDVIAEVRKWYQDFNKALEALGIEFAARLALYARMSAVLHLMEMEFFEDGTHSNLTAVKSAARLLQLEFNAASKVFANRDVCIAAAKWIYEATVVALTDKINAALNVCAPSSSATTSGGAEGAQASRVLRIHVVSVPQPPCGNASQPGAVAELALADLSLATLYEDLTQCYYRNSEVESVYWQRAGLAAPSALQAILDTSDNFNLLKVLKGKHGLMHSAQLATLPAADAEARVAPLVALSKSRILQCSPAERRVVVPHSFGSRTYVWEAALSSIGPSLETIYTDRYSAVREFLFANADVEMQEVLYALDQHRERLLNVIAEDAVQLRPLLEVLQSAAHLFWWVKGVQLDVGFQGIAVEEQLKTNGLLPVIQLRRVLPRRYIPCHAAFVVSTYKALLKPDQKGVSQMLQAESILSNADVGYLVSPEATILIESSKLLQLHDRYQTMLNNSASLVQAFARLHVTSKMIRARFMSWREAVSALDAQRQIVVTQHRMQVENAELHKLQRYEMAEKEATDRLMLRDQYWVAWVAMQTSSQQQMQVLLQKMVANAIRKEESSIKKAVSQSQRNAVEQLTHRIQERLLAQGSHLDYIVEQKEQQHAAAYKRLEREYETHKRIMAKKLEQEESKLELKQTISSKQSRSLKVALEREQQREVLRQKIWARQEKDRVAREQMEKMRNAIAANVEEQIAFDAVERNVAKRVADDIAAEQKRVRMEQAEAIRLAKKQREDQLIAAAKISERQCVRREMQQQRREEAEAAKRRKVEQELLLQQERERRAVERIRREEEKQNKSLTRSLLKAHEMLQNPVLFAHTANGTVQMLRSKQREPRSMSPGDGFILSGGKETHPRLFSPSVAANLLGHSSPRISVPGQRPQARDASPRSNFSI